MNLRKTTSISLNLKSLSKTHQSSLTLKGGSTSHLGLLPSGKKRKPLLLVALNRYAIRLADHQRSSPAAELRIFVRDKPQGHTMLDACSMLMEPQGHTNRCLMLIARNLLGLLLMGTQGPMLDAVMKILFIRLWTGLTLERFPSGLWRKSCDHHWHLMNDHNDRGYHL